MISAGRVLIKPRGEWNAETTYHMLDLVNHKGYAYLAKRTVVGIEPSDDYPEYWHNMLDINKIVKDAIAGSVADEVGDILEERFREMLGEALYSSDLFADYDAPTFVRWDVETANTPYSHGLTESSEGFALVYGIYDEEHSVVAWTKDGESFNHRVVGGTATEWDMTITSSGGTMSGPLGLGGGKGSVSADDDGAFLEAKNGNDFKRIKVKNDSLEESVKLETKEKNYNLFGEHNLNKIFESGAARICCGTYVGTGESGKNNPNILTFPFEPKVIFFSGADGFAIYGNTRLEESFVSQRTITITWSGKTVSWYYSGTNENIHQMNVKDKTYYYVAIG